jgi:hypothetical protein
MESPHEMNLPTHPGSLKQTIVTQFREWLGPLTLLLAIDLGLAPAVAVGEQVQQAWSVHQSTTGVEALVLVRYHPSDPAGAFRLGLQRDATGSLRLTLPAGTNFTIEVSSDLRQWSTITPDELQSLLHPAPPHPPPSAQRFYRLTRPPNF